jgi:hypothetical protein
MARLGATVVALLAAALASTSAVLAARAEPAPAGPTAEELSTARRLFEEALRATDAGRWEEALSLFLRIEKVAASPVVLFHIGGCHERLGHWVEALNAFERAEYEAKRGGKSDLAAEARARAVAARKKTGRLVIHVEGGSGGVRLDIDGKPIHADLAAAGLLVDPGNRLVRGVSPGGERVHVQTAAVAAGATVVVVVDLRASATQAPVSKATPPPPPPPDPPPSLAPVLVTAGGAAALGIGAVITGLAAHDKHEAYVAANEAPAPGSMESRRALREDGQALALASTLLTGGAVLAGGVAIVLVLTRPSAAEARTPPRRTAAIAPWTTVRGGGVFVRGDL